MDADDRTGKGAPVRAWLDGDFEAEPIQGTLSQPGGRPKPFVGWLGLSAALERLRAPGSEPGGKADA